MILLYTIKTLLCAFFRVLLWANQHNCVYVLIRLLFIKNAIGVVGCGSSQRRYSSPHIHTFSHRLRHRHILFAPSETFLLSLMVPPPPQQRSLPATEKQRNDKPAACELWSGRRENNTEKGRSLCSPNRCRLTRAAIPFPLSLSSFPFSLSHWSRRRH